ATAHHIFTSINRLAIYNSGWLSNASVPLLIKVLLHDVASAYVPVGKKALSQIIGFGKQKQIACVVISQAKSDQQTTGSI
ncbi:MAG: hypothetical protein ACP5DD_11810, partial [Vibrio sp.]